MELTTALGALFVSAFASATVLPGTSEAALAGLLHHYPHARLWAWLAAGTGNTLGSLVSYAMGRMLPERIAAVPDTVRARLARWGKWSLLLAWLPVLGDALPLAAGCLRWRVLPCALLLAVGKFARYAPVVWLLA
ncbi:YqaA family protein [Conchiformibius kuhniae]|uniref:YqaA family protein n=1 Tax=Conchiformibius kuhniae TaxID=211502 RepID=A0A8T9MRZ7_9NEIS|nr:DedA family protein [Conchiformibius kuhniae]UOP04670.1 DedA family protein [Conchiformibius kuhniae]